MINTNLPIFSNYYNSIMQGLAEWEHAYIKLKNLIKYACKQEILSECRKHEKWQLERIYDLILSGKSVEDAYREGVKYESLCR